MRIDPPPGPVSVWATRAIGALVVLIGTVLAAGGVWLVLVGGSPYYVLAGLALVGSGVLIIRLNEIGVWLYAATYVATVVWALWEVGLGGWALVPRLVGPTVLMILVFAIIPVLLPTRFVRRIVLAGAGSIATVVLALVIGVWMTSKMEINPLPKASGRMADSSNLLAGRDWPA